VTFNFAQVDRPSRQELGRVLLETRSMSSDWAPTFAAVDRALFLPDLMWPFDMDKGKSVSVDRGDDPDGWHTAAGNNVPIVTQWDDGEHTGREPGTVSTSSSSMPSVVYAMLQTLAVDEGMRVLDVGTGTGETSGALFHRLGHRRVTTIEVDRSVSGHARERLCAAGL
jgi:protein-L-isoaspartate O-methyltransferase